MKGYQKLMSNVKHYCLIKFHKNTGKIDTTLESLKCDLLKEWAMNSTPKTNDSIIFNKTTGELVYWISGTSNGCKLHIFECGTNIEYYCPGLLAAVNS